VQLIKPPFKYTGAKTKHIPVILEHLPDNKTRFVDAMGGSGVVALNVAANTDMKVVYNEANPYVSELFFESISSNDFIDQVERVDSKYPNTAEDYYALRDKYNSMTPCLYKTAHLYVLVCRSFNNQIRFNKAGHFNLLFGERNRLDLSVLRASVGLQKSKVIGLLGVNVLSPNFMAKLTQDTVVFFDPPYHSTDATYNNQWSDDMDLRFYQMLDTLTERGVQFMLTNVTENRGKVNKNFQKYLNRFEGKVVKLDGGFGNSSYHKSDKPTKEFLLISKSEV